jgi:hypothetical protein
MDNTYKMAWARAIVEWCFTTQGQKQRVHFDDLAPLIFGYYWNQTIFFHLEQGPNPHKRPTLHQMAVEKIATYQEAYDFQPKVFARVEDYVPIEVGQISAALKKDVSRRFQNVGNRSYPIYDLDTERRELCILKPEIICDHADILFELINYRWTQKLEQLNSAPKIAQKVRGTHRGKIKRGNLQKRFGPLLDVENADRKCFITDDPIPQGEVSIDHVIPWSYLYSDDLWNLVYVNTSANSSKNDRIPNKVLITKLETRNKTLLEKMKQAETPGKHIEELDLAIEKDYVQKFWIGCKG